MKLAVPYTTLFQSREKEFLEIVDTVELKNPILDFEVPTEKSLSLHLNEGIIQNHFWDCLLEGNIFDFLRENKIKCFSFDFGPAAEEVTIQDYYYVAKTDVLNKMQILNMATKRINFIKEQFDGIIAVENLNKFFSDAYCHVCEPDFIKEFVEKNNIALVLDIGHAEISAYNIGMNVLDYIEHLPLDKIVEIHISKAGMVNGVMLDCHEKPDVSTYRILHHIMDMCEPQYLVVEYYKDSDILLDIYRGLKRSYC